jgi:hypothetical protein
MKKYLFAQNILLGFLSWLFPFAVSFLFYKPNGELLVPYGTFKSSIMVIGLICGCLLLIRYFKNIHTDYIKNGLIVGWSWFAINIVLDILLLLPIMKTNFMDYFLTIGLSYISIPVISITIGYLLERKNNPANKQP